MKTLLYISLIFLLSGPILQGQEDIDRLAIKITKNSTSNIEKVESIYRWVTSNIKYDIRQLKDFNDFEYAQKASTVYRKKLAVCQGYANLLSALLSESDIINYVIMGEARTDNDDSLQRHSWNAILIDNKWHLVDATWDAGYIRNRTFVRRQSTDFFLQDPADFIKTHLPDDPIWQLLPSPISMQEFLDKTYDIQTESNLESQNILNAYLNLPLEKRKINSAKRQIAYNPNSAIGYYDLGMSYFDQANKYGLTYENLTDNYNSRAQWRTDKTKLKDLLSSQEELLKQAFSNFDMLEQKSPTYRATAKKNKSIISSVLRNIKNEYRLINEL